MDRMVRPVRAVLALFALTLLFPSVPRAENVAFVRDYTYQASEVDSKVSSRTVALEQVKRLLLEQVGTYVQSETVVRDFQLSKDEIVTLTAGIVSVEILKETWDGERYSLTARVTVDPQQVASAVEHLRGNTVDRAELESSRKEAEEALAEIARLKRDMEALRAQANRSEEQAAALKEKQEDFSRGVAELQVNGLLQKGVALLETGDDEGALAAFEEAVRLAPRDRRADAGRGVAQMRLRKLSPAIKDLDAAIELAPRFAKAYMLRGKAYRLLGQHRRAVKDQNKAIEINPSFAEAYFERGVARRKSGEREGIEDIERAATMGLKRAQEVLQSMGRI